MQRPACVECERLWQQYSSATFEHVNIDNRMKIAELRGDVSAELRGAHETPTQKREDAQRLMKEHEATHAEGDGSTMD